VDLVLGKVVVALDPQPDGAKFSVATRAGSVTAVGTAFAVELTDDGAGSSARVLHGTVVVRNSDGTESRLAAHEGMVVGKVEKRALSVDEERTDGALLVSTELWGRARSGALEVEATPRDALVRVDGRLMGPVPVFARLDPGHHTLATSADGRDPELEDVDLSEGERTRRTPTLTVTRPMVSDAIGHHAPAHVSASAADLLSRARSLRAKGQLRDAVKVYRELCSTYPASPEARASLVSLGELELGVLGNAHAALAAFDAYLKGDGSLRQEALYGRIRALRALGETTPERAAIASFLETFPESVQASPLRARLAELGGAKQLR
jgi:hypothetical protein